MSDNPKQNKPICTRCANFYLTYDYNKPYGCKAMGFKSKMSPAKLVLTSSGMECQSFTLKKRDGEDFGKNKFYA